MSTADVLEKVNKLEQDLQELKVGMLLGESGVGKKLGFYNEKKILQEAKKIRKLLWKERYAKAV